MGRKSRIFIENTPTYIRMDSIDSLEIFKDKEDIDYFFEKVFSITQKLDLKIHSYAIFKDYFEFLISPKGFDSIPKFMQTLGRTYVLYFNKKYDRTGTLWDGRYKSCIVEPTEYLVDVMCYIEAKSGALKSSLNRNLNTKNDELVTYHSFFKVLTQNSELRKSYYLKKINDSKRLSFIEACINKQQIIGSMNYIQNLEKKLDLTLITKNRGRPKKIKEEERRKMFKNLQVLDKEKHKKLKVSSPTNLYFAKELSFIPVLISEMSLVAETFPVLFTSGENPSLVTLVSLGGGSLAIDNEGKWITNYIPTHIRKYPFSIASTKENPNLNVILIDEDSSLLSETQGNELFSEDGEQTEALERAINFLKSNNEQSNMTKSFVKEIVNSGILEDREISVGEGEEKKVLVKGFKVIDPEKLKALDDKILASWVRNGITTLIDVHLKSLNKIELLFELANKRQS